MQGRTGISQTELDRALRMYEAYRQSKQAVARALFTYRDLSGCDLRARSLGSRFTGAFLVAPISKAPILRRGSVREQSQQGRSAPREAGARRSAPCAVSRRGSHRADSTTPIAQRPHHHVERTGSCSIARSRRTARLCRSEDGSVREPTPSAHTDFSGRRDARHAARSADLRKATLAGADLGGADLSGADFAAPI